MQYCDTCNQPIPRGFCALHPAPAKKPAKKKAAPKKKAAKKKK